MTDTSREFSWDSKIEDVQPEKPSLLPNNSEVEFTVLKLTKGISKASSRPMITLVQECTNKHGSAVIYDYLVFTEDNAADDDKTRNGKNFCKQKISSFLRSIGELKPGSTAKPDWDSLVGACGRALVKIESSIYQGENQQKNQIKSYLDPKPPAAIKNTDIDLSFP